MSKKWLRPLFRVFARGWRSASAPILRSRAGGEPPLPYCAPAPGRLYAEKQRKYGRPDTGPVCRAGQARCRKAKTAPLCKGSCRRTPTEGLTASRRTQAVLPHPTIENQLNHSPGFAIPPAWRCHAVPPLHKGGFSLPCGTGPGLHPGPFRRSRNTWARSPYSRGEFDRPGTGPTPAAAKALALIAFRRDRSGCFWGYPPKPRRR